MNFLTLVLDSCRFDSFQRANTPNIAARFEILEGHAIATFTFPAHAAMFQGFYPNCRADRPLYDRFASRRGGRFPPFGRSLLSTLYIGGRPVPESLYSVPDGLLQAGYKTFAAGGVSWFRSENPMSSGFERFAFASTAVEACDLLVRTVDRDPFYALLNFAETHRPYDCPWTRDRSIESPVSGTGYDSVYRPELHARQVRALEYLDTVLEGVFSWLSRRQDPTLVCLCADHGETFGEDGCFGHGFYHPNVMSVPVAWSLFESGGSVPVDWPILERLEACACGSR